MLPTHTGNHLRRRGRSGEAGRKWALEESRPPGRRRKCIGLGWGATSDTIWTGPGRSRGRQRVSRIGTGKLVRTLPAEGRQVRGRAAKRRRWDGAGSDARFRLGGVRQRLTGRAAKNCLVDAGLPGLGPNFHSEGMDRLRGSERSLLPSVRLASPGPPTEDHSLSLLSRKNGPEE